MITKLPAELVPGDRLARYDNLMRRLPPLTVLGADTPVAGTVDISTDDGPLRAFADVPVEVEP